MCFFFLFSMFIWIVVSILVNVNESNVIFADPRFDSCSFSRPRVFYPCKASERRKGPPET